MKTGCQDVKEYKSGINHLYIKPAKLFSPEDRHRIFLEARTALNDIGYITMTPTTVEDCNVAFEQLRVKHIPFVWYYPRSFKESTTLEDAAPDGKGGISINERQFIRNAILGRNETLLTPGKYRIGPTYCQFVFKTGGGLIFAQYLGQLIQNRQREGRE